MSYVIYLFSQGCLRFLHPASVGATLGGGATLGATVGARCGSTVRSVGTGGQRARGLAGNQRVSDRVAEGLFGVSPFETMTLMRSAAVVTWRV